MSLPTGRATPSYAEIEANPIIPFRGVRGPVTLAFDLSSSACGWAVGQSGKLERYGKLVFKGSSGIGEKLVSFGELCDVLLQTFRPNLTVLEYPLSRHNKVTQRHYELVGVLRAAVYANLGYEIEQTHFIAPVTIKKWLEIPKGKGANHDHNKLLMVNKINDLFDLQLRYDPNSKAQTDDDTADAIAALVTWYRREGRD